MKYLCGGESAVAVYDGKAERRTNTSVFCPDFQKGRVPSEKGTFSAVNGPSKGHN